MEWEGPATLKVQEKTYQVSFYASAWGLGTISISNSRLNGPGNAHLHTGVIVPRE